MREEESMTPGEWTHTRTRFLKTYAYMILFKLYIIIDRKVKQANVLASQFVVKIIYDDVSLTV